eukprot:UN09729
MNLEGGYMGPPPIIMDHCQFAQKASIFKNEKAIGVFKGAISFSKLSG